MRFSTVVFAVVTASFTSALPVATESAKPTTGLDGLTSTLTGVVGGLGNVGSALG